MAMHGCVLLCRPVYCYVGLCMDFYGYIWLFRAVYGCVCLCRALYCYVWLCLAVYGYLELSRAMWGCVWLCMAICVYVGLCKAMESNVYHILTNGEPRYDGYTTYLLK